MSRSSSRKKPRNSSCVWNHFKEVEENEKKMNKCTLCLKFFSKQTSTTTLYVHLANVHQIELLDNRNEAAAESCSNSEDETPISQQARTSCRAKHGKKQQKLLDEKLLRFIISDLQAFNICESPEFSDLCTALDRKWTIPNSHTIRERLNDKYDLEKSVLKDLVSNTNSKLSFTTMDGIR